MKSFKEFKQEMLEATSVDELSNELLDRYKTSAGKSATTADAAGDFKKGDKRFSGIVQATKKQFKNDLKKYSEDFDLDEANSKKEPMKLYHSTYSAALAHAKDQLNSRGFDISDDDWFHHISSGPVKPAEGKTNRLSIPLTNMDGTPTKKYVHIQIHNIGNDVPNNHELNMYVDK